MFLGVIPDAGMPWIFCGSHNTVLGREFRVAKPYIGQCILLMSFCVGSLHLNYLSLLFLLFGKWRLILIDDMTACPWIILYGWLCVAILFDLCDWMDRPGHSKRNYRLGHRSVSLFSREKKVFSFQMKVKTKLKSLNECKLSLYEGNPAPDPPLSKLKCYQRLPIYFFFFSPTNITNWELQVFISSKTCIIFIYYFYLYIHILIDDMTACPWIILYGWLCMAMLFDLCDCMDE